jgi:glutathione reductase (NADPH)
MVDCGEGVPGVEADLVVNATGRVPAIDGLDLDAVGIAHGPKGIAVDQHLRSTSHGHVWAAGDVADSGRPPLTPTASEDGRVVAHNVLHPDTPRKKIDTPVASVAFTLPPLASAGLSEADARAQHGDTIDVVTAPMSDWKHFRQQNEKHAYHKFIFGPDDKLLGAHLVGKDSDEVINTFAAALHHGCDKSTLCDTTLAYPTVAFSLQNVLVKQGR